jgi:hypothetical protein
MNWNDLGDILNRYAQDQTGNADDDFDRVAPQVPRSAVSQSVAEAFRSPQTEPFPNMLGQMFGQAAPGERANILNSLLSSLGPAVLSGMLSRGGGGVLGGLAGGSGGLGGLTGGTGGLGGLLGELFGGGTGSSTGGTPQITPDQASQIPPEAVEELAREAEQRDPSVIDRVSEFAAENPTLVKGLGAAALGIALNHLAKQKRGGLF